MADFHLDVDAIFWAAEADTGTFIYVSPQVERILGYSAKKWLGTKDFWKKNIHPDDQQMALLAHSDQNDSGEKVRVVEYRMRAADGSWKWFQDHASLVEEEGLLKLKGMLVDITAARQIGDEQALLLNNMDDAFFLIDKSFNIVTFNDICQTFFHERFGTTLVKGKNIIECFPQKIQKTERARYKRILLGKSEQAEFEAPPSQPRYKNYYVSFQPARDKNGQVVGIVTYTTNISERKQVEEVLQLSEKRFRSLVQDGNDLITILDRDGTYEYVSPTSNLILGLSPEELVGKNVFDYIHDDDQERVWEEFSGLATQKRISMQPFRFVNASGDVRWIETVVTNLTSEPAVGGIVANSRDVTEQISAAQTIAQSEKRFRALVQNGADLTAVLDEDGIFRYVSPSYESILGYQEKDLLGIDAFTYFHPDDLQASREAFERLKSENRVSAQPYRYRRKDGSWAWHRSIGTNLTKDPAIAGMVINTADITELVEAREAVKESRDRFQKLIQASSESIFDVDLLTNELHITESFTRHFGHQTLEPQDNRNYLRSLVHPDDRERMINSYQKAIDDPNQEVRDVTYRLRKANGDYALVEDHLVILRDDKGKAYRTLGMLKDITSVDFYRRMDEIEKDVMTLSMRHDTGLKSVLNFYLSGLERLFPELWFSVMRVDDSKLFNLSSPSVPEALVNAINGSSIGPKSGSCGTAAYLREATIVENVHQDERWEDYADLAKEFKFSACWSEPILDAESRCIATFAAYCPESRPPGITEKAVFGRSVRLLSIILSRFGYLDEIRRNNERNYYVNRATNDAIYDWDIQSDGRYLGDGFDRLFGHKPRAEGEFSLSDWYALVHPDDRGELKEELTHFLESPKEERWENSYRFRRDDGRYTYVNEVGYLIRDRLGLPERMIGALRDESDFRLREIKREMQQEISRYFTERMNLKHVLEETLHYLADFREFEAAEIWLINSTEEHLDLAASYGGDKKAKKFYENSKEITRLEPGQGLSGRVWKNLEIQIWSDLGGSNSAFVRGKAAQKAGFKAAFGLPLFQRGKFTGVMVFFSRQSIDEDRTLTESYIDLGEFLGSEIRRKQQEEQMYLLFESGPEILAIAGTGGHFIKANPAFCDLLGYTEEEITSRPFEDFVHPDDRKKTMVEHAETSDTGRSADNFINRYRTRSGEYRWITWSSSKPFNDEGMVFSYGRDITEMVRLQALFDDVSHLTRVGTWEYRIDEDYMYWSGVTRAIHEVEENFVPDIENGIAFYKPDSSRDRILASVAEAMQSGTPYDLELQIVTAKGTERWVRAMGNAEIIDGHCRRLYGSFQDIQEQKEARIQLDRKNQFLETASKVIGTFLHSNDWSSALGRVFELSAEAVDVDRICYLQCREVPETSELLVDQAQEWVREPFRAHGDDPRFRNIVIKEVAPAIHKRLVKGEPVRAYPSQLPRGIFRSGLEDYETKAVLLIPVLVEQQLYGILTFADCHEAHEWIPDEIWLIDSITSSLAAAIHRYDIQSSLEKAFDERNSILESIGDAFASISADWTVTYWNQQAETLTGVKREAILGRSLWSIFPEGRDSVFFKCYNQVLQTKESGYIEEYYEPLKKWIDISAYPSEVGISLFFKDVTERKKFENRLRESNARFEKVSEATNDVIWDWDILADILYWGARYATLFGYKVETLPRKSELWADPVHPTDRPAVLESLSAAISDSNTSNWRHEYRYQKANGDYAFVVDQGVIIRDAKGQAVRMVGAMRDISDSKRNEADLLHLNEKLQLYAGQLETSNKELEQFAYIASHDLQEPLRMVSSFLGLLESKYADQLDENAVEYIGFAVDGAVRMRQIILDLLSYSRVGKYSGRIEKVVIEDVVEEVCVLYRNLIEEKQAQIQCIGRLPKMKIYKSPVQQILQNLIGNALKYSRPNVKPEIKIQALDDGDFWHFSVEDNGLGIESQYFDKVFVLFQRLHAKEQYEGTGIGLSVVKKAVEQLGGQLWLESELGQGSTFHFTLPKVMRVEAEDS